MPQPHREASRRTGLRWVAGLIGLVLAGAVALAMTPASAGATTVTAQLSLSGVATQSNVLGGTTVGVHPGDTVQFEASPVPTAGLDNIPVLGSLLDSITSGLLQGTYQVVLRLPASFPGGARTVTLGGPTSGPCAGTPSLPVSFPNVGTYGFTWSVQYVLPTLLGCSKSGLSSTDLNSLKSAGIAINATNQWTGQVVVADNPPAGGISVQLPAVGAAPSLPVVGQLPTISVPALKVPTVPVSIPSVPGGGGKSTTAGGGSTSGAPGGNSTGYPSSSVECVPCHVMTHPGLGGGFNGPGPDAGSITRLGSDLGSVGVVSTAPGAVPSAAPNPTTSTKKQVDLAANRAPAAQVPVLLAIIAIIALALVTATYAKLYLLRRNV